MVYLLYGEDDFLKSEYLKKFKKQFGTLQVGINYIQLDSESIESIIADIDTPAFGFESKLIIAKNSGLFKKKNAFSDKLSEYLNNNKIEGVELIFDETEVEKNSLFNTISKIGKVQEFKELTVGQLIQKITEICNAYGVKIQGNIAQYLIECVGTNMQDIINELRKLIEYAGKGNEILKDDIDKLVTIKSDSIIFDLTDNLGRKNIKKAIQVYNDLIYKKEDVFKIVGMLYSHFKKLYIIKLSDGKNVAQNLNLKPNQTFLVNKYQQQANFFKKEDVESILKELINLDEKCKKGDIDLEVGLQTILCRYCSNN